MHTDYKSPFKMHPMNCEAQLVSHHVVRGYAGLIKAKKQADLRGGSNACVNLCQSH